jgi:hypothetical protein
LQRSIQRVSRVTTDGLDLTYLQIDKTLTIEYKTGRLSYRVVPVEVAKRDQIALDLERLKIPDQSAKGREAQLFLSGLSKQSRPGIIAITVVSLEIVLSGNLECSLVGSQKLLVRFEVVPETCGAGVVLQDTYGFG